MKKLTIICFATLLLFSFMFVSCGEKSKEEKFLSDLEEYVEKIEKVKSIDDLAKLVDISDIYEKKMESLYGVKGLEDDDIKNSGLNLTDKQKDIFFKLKERFFDAAAKIKQLENESEEHDTDLGSSDLPTETDDTELSSINTEDLDDTSNSTDEDWDELLNSYEEYVDKYISYIKKAAKGDMSALSEYPALMDKAKEFSEKMENAQSDMSASQWARYLKITNKMTKAAAEMQ